MAAERMPGLIPTNSTRMPGPIRSFNSTACPIMLERLYNHLHELAVQGRTDALRLRRARQGQEDDVERCQESRRAETPAVGEEGRPHFLLPHRRREGRGRRVQGARRRLRG